MNTEFPTGGSGPGAGGGMRARCVVHPDNLAGGTCTRCGNFLCYVDTEGGRYTTCEACRNRTSDAAFPLTRQTYSFQALWDHSWNMFKVHWLMLSVGLLVPGVVGFVMMLFANVFSLPLGMLARGNSAFSGGVAIGSFVFLIAYALAVYLVIGALGLGYVRMVQDVQEGRPPDIGRMFSQFSKLPRAIVVFILTFIAAVAIEVALFAINFGATYALMKISDSLSIVWTVIGTFALPIAIFLLLSPFYFVFPELSLTESVGPIDIFRNVWKIAEGHRLDIFLVWLVFIPIAFAGLLACCVGILPAYALIAILFANLHRGLRNGADGIIGEASP